MEKRSGDRVIARDRVIEEQKQIADGALANRRRVRTEHENSFFFMCRPYGARSHLKAYPPFRLRMRSPSGWANLSPRLRRWILVTHDSCSFR
jgi:hypothetical protein